MHLKVACDPPVKGEKKKKRGRRDERWGIMNETGKGKRGNARKRKVQVEQAGPHKKKQRYQPTRSHCATSFKDDDFTQEQEMHNPSDPSDQAGHSNMCQKGQNYTTRSKRNMNKQQQNKKPEGQKNQHQQRDGWRPANRGGGHQTRPTGGKGGRYSKNINDQKDVRLEPTRSMSQEFMDQNAFLVDGRLMCRHFLFGKCIKGDGCQLEHIEGFNDIVKTVCKFYVQGFCSKGESCPYMHKSFPCKYFHSTGKCNQGADCRFSHEPLNDVTNRLFCEALKRAQEVCELRKKAEQKASGQPENTVSENIEANKTPDTPLQPLRPNLYNSEQTSAEKETLICQSDDRANVMEEAVPPHASDAAQPHIPPSSNLNYEEPVCYSVEAVLGPQLFKPFPSFFTPPGRQESATSDSTSQSEAPYSVDAVLRSYKSVENSTPTPPTAQTVSYTPKTDSGEDPLLNSETHDEKVFYLVNTRNEVSQENTSKSQSSLHMHTGLISKSCCRPPLAFRDYKKQGGYMPESLTPAQRAAHEVKAELQHSPVTEEDGSTSSKNKGTGSMHLPLDSTCSVNCKSEGDIPFRRTDHRSISSRLAGQTSTSRHPTHLSALTSDSQASMKPFYPSSAFTEFKGGSAVPVESVTCSMKTSNSANSVRCHFAVKQPTVEPVEPDKASARPFLSLFATPLPSTESLDYSRISSRSQHSNRSVKNTSRLSNSKQRTSNLETPLPGQVRTDFKEIPHVARSPRFSSNPKIGNEDVSTEHVNQPTKQLMNPVCRPVSGPLRPTPCGNSPSTTHAHLHSKKTTAGLKRGAQQHHSTAITAESSSKMASRGDLAAGSQKTLRRPGRSLFASPFSDALQPIDDSVTDSSCPQGFIQSSRSPQPADDRSNLVKNAVEPGKGSARPFLSLFATPLPSIESLDYSRFSSCSQRSNQSVKNTSQLSNSKQRASNLQTPLPGRVRADFKEVPHVARSPSFSANPKIGKEDNSTEHVNQPTEQLVNPICSPVSDSVSPAPCGNSPSTTRAHQQLPDISSHKGSVVAATANSVLKTLFRSLGPYQEDGEQQDR